MKKQILSKQILACLLATTMVTSLFVGINNVKTQAEIVNALIGATWRHVHASYEASDELIANTTVTDATDGFDANISITGWQRCWDTQYPPEDAIILDHGWADMPEQLYSEATASVVAGETYELKTTITNAMVAENTTDAYDKHVTITISSGISGDNDNTMLYKTYKIPANDSLDITESFEVPNGYELGAVVVRFSYGAYAYSREAKAALDDGTITSTQYETLISQNRVLARDCIEPDNLSGLLSFSNIQLIGESTPELNTSKTQIEIPTVAPTTTNTATEPATSRPSVPLTSWSSFSICTREDGGAWEDSLKSLGLVKGSDYATEGTIIQSTPDAFLFDVVNSGWDGMYNSATGELIADNPWGMTASMTGIQLEPNGVYTLTFDVMSTLTAGLQTTKHILFKAYEVGFGDAAFNISNYTNCTSDGIIELKNGEDWKTVQLTFTVPSDFNGTAGFRFALGAFQYTYPNELAMSGQIGMRNFCVTKIATVAVPTTQALTTQALTTVAPATTTATAVTTAAPATTTAQTVTTVAPATTTATAVTTAAPATTAAQTVTTATPATTTVNEYSTSATDKIVKPAKVKIKKIKRKAKSATITIKKVKTADGYQIKYGANKKLTKNVTTKLIKKTSYTIKKLNASKKYYTKVRAYVLHGQKKVFGKWSKVKVIRKFK